MHFGRHGFRLGSAGPLASETFDVNVLVYATHRDSPFHQQAKTLVERFLAGPDLVDLRTA